ncbi:MAG TPA: hypothetical protein VF490_13740 [Chryseosolibacter sp.]
MKKFMVRSLAGSFLLGLTLSACELFNKLDDVTFDVTLPLDFVIDEQLVSQNPVVYSDVAILDATDDPEVAKYKDKIREIRLNKITYEISNFAAPGAVSFTNGSLKLASGETLVTASSIPLQNTAETELTSTNPAGFNAFAADILGDKQVGVNLDGTFSETPVAFTLTARFYVTITADALK